MWKCASKTLKATFQKGYLRCSTVLSTKAPVDKSCKTLLKFTPIFIEHLNRYYGFYKNSCGKFSKSRKDREGPNENKSSFLGGFQNNVVDALGWSGILVLGYYFLQPFTRKRTFSKYEHYNQSNLPVLVEYQKTLQYLFNSVDIKPFHCILPELKAAKAKANDLKEYDESTPQNLKSEPDTFNSLEKAHQKVLGALSNLMGAKCMENGEHKEALEYFRQAANKDNPAGIFNLGICHERGLGTNKNTEMAAKLYQRAADLGHATAMYNLGVFYVQGLGGIEPDVKHARELFKAAASLGQRDAVKALDMEKQTPGEVLNQISMSNEQLPEQDSETSLADFICSDLLQNFVDPPRRFNACDVRNKNSDCDSLGFSNGKDISVLSDSDSGVLDLSPHNESNVLPI